MLYTRKGDCGTTDLADGSRVPKTHPRMVCVGTIDELSSFIGWLLALMRQQLPAEALQPDVQLLLNAQRRCFALGALAAAVPQPQGLPDKADILALERAIDAYAANYAASFRGFVLPGGHPLAAQCHVCRTLVRRLERELLSAGLFHAAETEADSAYETPAYVNRLSDYLYALAKKSMRSPAVPKYRQPNLNAHTVWQQPGIHFTAQRLAQVHRCPLFLLLGFKMAKKR